MEAKEKAIEFFMKEEVGLLDENEKPLYPLQLNETIDLALKIQAKEIFDDIDKVYGTRSYPDIRKKWVGKE